MLIRRFSIIAFCFLTIWSFAGHLYAACQGSSPDWTVASPYDDADMQDCVNSASDGDTISIPNTGGTVTWSTPVDISKGLIIKGAGIGNTVIQDDTPGTYHDALFSIDLAGSEYIEISDMTIYGPTTNGNGAEGSILIYSSSNDTTGNNFRIHNIKLDNLKDRGIKVSWVYGLIDNCTFEDTATNNSVQGVSVFGRGGTAWSTDTSLGSADFVFVEDCTFNYTNPEDGALDAYNGANYVFRYNTVINTPIGHHGRDSGYPYRSVRLYEIYHNSFTVNINISRMFLSRGGTGVIYSNTWDTDTGGSYSAGVQLTYY